MITSSNEAKFRISYLKRMRKLISLRLTDELLDLEEPFELILIHQGNCNTGSASSCSSTHPVDVILQFGQ